MNLPMDQIEALIFFGEITIGQIGFEVIAVSLGRRVQEKGSLRIQSVLK